MLEKKAYFKLSDLRPLNKPMFKDNLFRDFGIEADAEAIAQYKTASAKSAELESNGDNTKFDLEAEIKGHPDSLFVKCFAIKADEMNDNGDYFSQDELIKATPTFVGVPVFTNHQNSDINQARGKVVHSWWDAERNGIAVIARVDAEAYPQLARGIKEEYIVGTSMGCQVKYSLCSVCHNKAETPDQYCEHIRERKTRQINARSQKCSYHKHGDQNECPICGSTKDQIKAFAVDSKAFEYNYGIKFIENSFVVNPACHECGVTEIIDPQVFLQKVSAISSILPKLLKAAGNASGFCDDNKCVKLAGQKEIGELNQALDLLTSVSQSMLQQKEQIDLEFLSDLVSVLADLQTVTDELTEQGYGRLQSPGGEEQAQPAGEQTTGEQTAPGQQQVTHAVNPTPGGGSKIQSGPAGNVGTVTSPTGAMAAKKQLNLEKTAKGMFKNKTVDLRIPPILRGLISHSTNRLLDLQFKLIATNELSIPFKMTRNIK